MTDPDPAPPRLILLAEDDDDVALVASRILEQAGHRVVRAATADDVLPLLIREQPELLLLDVMMPSEEGLDGFDICRRIRESATHRNLPIVMLSAIAEGTGKSEEQMRRATNADAYLHKPFEAQRLLETIAPLLGR
ncbi:response regulator [Candidatus Sumerlaeota bacterium]|nr:response regulator [Candidatus Sumerlaeota bacterium]